MCWLTNSRHTHMAICEANAFSYYTSKLTLWQVPTRLILKSIQPVLIFIHFFMLYFFSPWGLQGNSVAMARFGEVTGHEMGWLWIVRPYLRGILSKTKKCKALKEAIAYPISPPVFQRQNNLCSQITTVMLTCRFNNLIHDVYMPSLENIFGLCKMSIFFI